jgi:hypothetical protein
VCPDDPQHGQDPRCGGETLYSTHRTSAPQKSRTSRAAGVRWGIHGVFGDPLRLLGKRATLSPSRSADSAGWVELIRLGCEEWSPDVRTPVPSFLERSPALQTPVSPQRRCLALLPWWVDPFAHDKLQGSGVCSETKR